MKKTLAALTIFAVLAVPASSAFAKKKKQRINNPNPIMKSVLDINAMQKRIQLTDEQAVKIYEINKSYLEKYFQNRKDIEKVKSLGKEHRTAVHEVFTDEQKTKMSERKDKRGKRGKKKAKK